MGLVIRSVATNADPQTGSAITRAANAISEAISVAAISEDQIGLLINTGVYRDFNMVEPAIAALIQKQAGIGLRYQSGGPATYSFDLMNGACGPLNAIHAAKSLMAFDEPSFAVVVSGDTHPSTKPELIETFPVQSIGGALVLELDSTTAGFGQLKVASSSEPVSAEGYLDLSTMGTQGRDGGTIVRPEGHEQNLLKLAADAAQQVIVEEKLDLAKTLVLTTRSQPDFAALLAAELQIDSHSAVNAEFDGDPHTSALTLAYQQAHEAGRFAGFSHLLFVAAGGGPTAAAISYALPAGVSA